jgi:uncharacterized membrane protein (DUF373 family)
VTALVSSGLAWGLAALLSGRSAPDRRGAVAGATALLVAQFNTLLRLRDTPTSTLAVEILDGLLLIFIFVELLYAVRVSLRSHEIVVEPFLVVGILAAIKEIVVLSVEAATLLEKGPEFSRAAVEIGVLGGVVLVLSVAAFVMRLRTREGGEVET